MLYRANAIVPAFDVTEVRALERQLQRAQKFETIGQLAGGIAHDFNNVLGAVLGWAEIGYDQSHEHRQLAEYFAHIRQQADRAAALTRELQKPYSPTSLASMIREILDVA